MARRRFFVEAIVNGKAEITGERAWHLSRVLRAQPGQRYEIFDNRRVYLAEIRLATKDRVVLSILEELAPTVAPLELTLMVSLIKFDHFEWALEKATELGVARLVPVVAERSEKGLEKAAEKRYARWQRIVVEAAQQARRSRLPEVCLPIKLEQALVQAGGYRYWLEETGQVPSLLEVLPPPVQRTPHDRVAIVVGPEGGWVDRERRLALTAGWTPVSLNPFILRAETAAIAATAILVNAWMSATAHSEHTTGTPGQS